MNLRISKNTQNRMNPNDPEEWRMHFAALSPLQQTILKIIVMAFYVERKGDLNQCFALSGLRNDNGNKLHVQRLNVELKALINAGFLNEDYHCPVTLLQPIAELAFQGDTSVCERNLAVINVPFSSFKGYELHSRLDEVERRRIFQKCHKNELSYPLFEVAKTDMLACARLFAYAAEIFFAAPMTMAWLKARQVPYQSLVVSAKCLGLFAHRRHSAPNFAEIVDFYIDKNRFAEHVVLPFVKRQLLQVDVYLGKLDPTCQTIQALPPTRFDALEVQGVCAFLAGQYEVAVKCYTKAQKAYSQALDKHEWFQANIHGIIYLFALWQIPRADVVTRKINQALKRIDGAARHPALAEVLQGFNALYQRQRSQAVNYFTAAQQALKSLSSSHPLLNALLDWLEVLLFADRLPAKLPEFQEKMASYLNQHLKLIAQLYAELILTARPEDQAGCKFLATAPFGEFRFLKLFEIKPEWLVTLDELTALLMPDRAHNTQTAQAENRLVWLVDPKRLHIDVREQKLRKNGTWTVGKSVAAKRLCEPDERLNYLTEQDRRALEGLRKEVYGWYNHYEYSWDKAYTLAALVNHPRVFHLNAPDIALELVLGDVTLYVDESDDGYRFSLSHRQQEAGVLLEPSGPACYQVINYTDEMVRLCQLIPEAGLSVPKAAKEQVLQVIHSTQSGIMVQSDVDSEAIAATPANAVPCLHILPESDGVRVRLWIKPFGEQGPLVRAGEGRKTLVSVIDTAQGEARQKVVRDFSEESANVAQLLQACPQLADSQEVLHDWSFDDLESSLELLTALRSYKQAQAVHIEWPQGQHLKLKKIVSSEDLSLSLKGRSFWFEYDGEVALDDAKVLDMQSLLNLLSESPGRFVRIGEGEFIALTEKFKRQLEELKARSHDGKLYHLGTNIIEDLAAEAGKLEVDRAWKTHLRKIKERKSFEPRIPAQFAGQLRDYQHTGFTHLSRLVHWEIGACLADDMGLGKTVQTIALLIEQAKAGPILIVAPTSVCFNWLNELARFAPTLTPYALHQHPNRTALIAQLSNQEVLICSYTLLHQQADDLLNKTWQLVVLDEAQAIKNRHTKRWKTATQLNSQRRIALTGTPIENHLGELWSLFHFLNPGLLGSVNDFQARFQGPIERYQDPIAKRSLKNLIQPYIMRRTKSEVLVELPPKTEQAILIEPSIEERSLYEAARQNALARIAALSHAEPGQKRFGILAEITRLRQACCHPCLLDDSLTVPSSKVATFLNLLKNAHANGHKALVFSQYVSYLKIIEKNLKQEGFDYQYLDGATPQVQRRKSIEAFQSGSSDLFLISLKAGGLGLNLTAADTVFILDPWWNPAVEDQAADRAHRMGQSRPVTVYRLIMKNTIEEKIIQLHQDKRDLSADLLSSNALSKKFSEEDLLALISAGDAMADVLVAQANSS